MKKSKEIILTIVIASVLTACSRTETPKKPNSRFHVRADTTNKHYTTQRNHGTSFLPLYYGMRFMPTGIFSGGTYHRSGFYNSRTYRSSTAHNTPHVTTGGFGRTGHSGFHVSS